MLKMEGVICTSRRGRRSFTNLFCHKAYLFGILLLLTIILCCINLDWILYNATTIRNGNVRPIEEEKNKNQQLQINNRTNEVIAVSDNNYINTTNNDTTPTRYKCPNHLYTNGKWVKVPNHNTEATTTKTPTYDYEWVPYNVHECELEPWSQESFCSIVQNRSILVVGDSVNEQLYSAIVTSLEAISQRIDVTYVIDTDANTTDTAIIAGRKRKKNPRIVRESHAMICNNHSSITFVRNDWLTIDGRKNDQFPALSLWLHHLQTHDVVLLNSGAHAIPVSTYNESFIELNQYLLENYNGTVIFRTTPRGHIGCTKRDTEPIVFIDDDGGSSTTIQNNETYNHPTWQRFFNITEGESYYTILKYRYDLFPQYDSIMKHVAFQNNYHVIDITPIYELRPDIHKPPRDCLHIYETDEKHPFKIWLQLFLNELKGNLD